MVKFRVDIDHNVCQGFGACIELCNKFSLSDADGKSHVEGGEKITDETVEAVELDELDCHMEAAKACPFNAIHIINLQTNEQLV